MFEAFLVKLCIGILGTYVALTNSLAQSLQHTLVSFGLLETPPIVEFAARDTHDTETTRRLPSRYSGEGIPRILLESLEYQQAAVAGAGTSQSKSSEPTKNVEDALVNIFCAYRDGQAFRATTGSGVFIDPKGIILTNAHVAQFLLITEFRDQARCTIRQGNPAEDRYEARLLYVSPAWVHANSNTIVSKDPKGTGERDYALLFVSRSLGNEKPESFPFLSLRTEPLRPENRGMAVRAGGYPAEIFREDGPRAELIPKVSPTTVLDLLTFSGKDADLMAVGDSSVGEQGASGGPIVDAEGKVVGLIVTKGDPVREGKHSLRAITLPYIDRTIKEETGFDLATTLEGNIERRADVFENALIPFLARLIKNEM